MSYDRHLFVTLVADAASAPDVDLLAELMRREFDALRQAVLGEQSAKADTAPAAEPPLVTPPVREAA
jgi:hypothetical protein